MEFAWSWIVYRTFNEQSTFSTSTAAVLFKFPAANCNLAVCRTEWFKADRKAALFHRITVKTKKNHSFCHFPNEFPLSLFAPKHIAFETCRIYISMQPLTRNESSHHFSVALNSSRSCLVSEQGMLASDMKNTTEKCWKRTAREMWARIGM